MFLLSICIPTYNRSSKLGACLEMLVHEAKISGLEKYIEIVVVDNASTDNTRELVNAFRIHNKYIAIEYFCNEKNLGVDNNCHIAINSGSGEFCWLFCDDDQIEQGGLKFIFDSCSNNRDVNFIYANYRVNSNGKMHESRCNFRENVKIEGYELFTATNLALSFATSCLFNRKSLNRKKLEEFIGTKWYHIYAAKECLLNAKVLIIGVPYLIQNSPNLLESRKEKKRTDNDGLEFYISAHLNIVNFIAQLKNTIYCKSNTDWRRLFNIVWRDNFYQIVNYKTTLDKSSFLENIKIIASMTPIFCGKPLFWLVHVPVLLMPNKSVLALHYWFRKLYRK